MENYINRRTIQKYGYNFNDTRYERMFIDFLNEELALQVGFVISKLLTPEQIKEINHLAATSSEDNTTTITAFLTETIHDSSLIVEKPLKRFYRQLRFNKKTIMKKYQQYKEAITPKQEF